MYLQGATSAACALRPWPLLTSEWLGPGSVTPGTVTASCPEKSPICFRDSRVPAALPLRHYYMRGRGGAS
jgi:hypothetical protein